MLTVLFVIIVVCCLIEVYRSDLEYKKRIERETDEDIIWSKEQATKLHESPGAAGSKTFNYKSVSKMYFSQIKYLIFFGVGFQKKNSFPKMIRKMVYHW